MGYRLEQFYSMSWPEFFTYKEAFELTEWEENYKFRLNYVLATNSAVRKRDQITVKDILPSPLDEKFLASKRKNESITLAEAIEIAKMDGQHLDRSFK